MKANSKKQTSEPLDDGGAPVQVTFAQNVIFMIRLIAIAALVIAALWGLDQWSLLK